MKKKTLKNSPPHRWAGRLKMKHIRKIIELKEQIGLSVRRSVTTTCADPGR